ncbi:MAG TPA: hypothetical protein VM639_17325 [Dongiaceae bacterium]|nr:hypothetical protein [Dongiaceae bacterium]
MFQIAREFDDLLSPAGRRVLAGRDAQVCGALADPRRRFIALDGMVAHRQAENLRRVLEEKMLPHLTRMEAPIPPETIWDMRQDYEEWLPKTVRVMTAYLENRRGKAMAIAREIGLIDLLSSASFIAFAEAVAGRKLDPKGGQQVLCYGPGDYAGPHNDHHPENKRAAQGYLDIHLSLANRAVQHQYLVYAKAGHFTEIVPVTSLGGLTIYRLPFWHYTTPLTAVPGKAAQARRWLLLGTFLYAKEKAHKAAA